MKTPTATRRYPGAKPFTTEEQDIFFGRREDLRRLYERIQLEPLVVLYGKSGLGKSSIINAGILPEVEKASQLSSFSIRFGAYTEGKTESPLVLSLESIRSAAPDPLLRQLLPEDDSLWRQLKTRQAARPGQTSGFLLVFDQFEELFTYPLAQVEEFAGQLA